MTTTPGRWLALAALGGALSCVALRDYPIADADLPADGGVVDRPTVDLGVAVDVPPAADVVTATDLGAPVVDVGAPVVDVGVDTGPTVFAAGNPCTSDAQCGADGCIVQAGWTGGYCTRRCNGNGDCGPNGGCVDEGTLRFCGRACTRDAECRSGYLCEPVSASLSVCFPRCSVNPGAICGEMLCDPATDECGDPSCRTSAMCSSGSRCSGGECECTATTDCGPNSACIDGLCGCRNNAGCAPLGTCDSNGDCR